MRAKRKSLKKDKSIKGQVPGKGMGRIERALRESETGFADVYNSMSEGVAIHEIVYNKSGKAIDYIIVEVNPAYEKITNKKRSAVIGKKASAVYGLAAAPYLDIYAQVASTGKPTNFETHFPPMDRYFTISVFSPVKGRFATVFQDITVRKRAEEDLRKLNRALMALSRSSQAMMRLNDEMDYLNEVCRIVIEDCGHAMVWIGFAEQDEAKTVRAVAQAGFEEGYLKTVNITWADTERGQGPTGTAIRTGTPSFCRNMLTDSKFKPWREEALKRGYASSIVMPLISSGGVFGAITIYAKDPDPFTEKEVQLLSELADDVAYGITAIRLRIKNAKAEEILKRDKETFENLVQERTSQLVAAEIELEKTKRLSDIGILAATVAHELRNPLAAMNMAAYNIRRKAQNADIEKHLATIENKVAESDQIINNLLFYSRLKSPHYEMIKIADIIEECAIAMEKQGKREAMLCINLEPIKDVIIEADPLQVREVFNNILNNAQDAVQPEKGRINIIAKNEDEYIKVVIEDNGEGISRDNLDRIFDPFFTTKSKGTGLGLSICRQIVNIHGGEIGVESELGKGTSISVSLPKQSEKG